MNVRDKYRIVTNGLKFRVEAFRMCGFWLWKKEKWLPFKWLPFKEYYLFSGGSRILEFMTLESAQRLMDEQIAKEEAEIRGWSEVEQK